MPTPTIERVELVGIHQRYNLDISFKSTLNILYGENGTGKSTLIHIIANVSNGDFIRFAFLDFFKIKVTYSNQFSLTIKKELEKINTNITVSVNKGDSLKFSQREAIDVSREIEDSRYDSEIEPELSIKILEFIEENNIPIIKNSYFPAFRTMLEAWSSQIEQYSEFSLRHMNPDPHPSDKSTKFSRRLFGPFLPTINYPSPIDIERYLNGQIRHCQIKIASYERSIFSDSFVKVFSALLEGDSENTDNIDPNTLIKEISVLTNDFTNNRLSNIQEDTETYRELRDLVFRSNKNKDLKGAASEALLVYRNALQNRRSYQERIFKNVDTYFEIVNFFLNEKQLSYSLDKNRRMPRIGLRFPDDTWSKIRVMSSGERQLLTMLYAVNRMSNNSIVLIDEPEISLHIDWQENLLEKMMEQLKDRQIIVCTHSPAIASDFTDHMIKVEPIFTKKITSNIDLFDEEEDEGEDY